MKHSEISVLMVVCKNDRWDFLISSIHSINEQTYLPKELVLVFNGGFTLADETLVRSALHKDIDLVSLFVDVKVILARALNLGLDSCTSHFVARHDPDDLCLQDRLKIQVDFMNMHTECVASSAHIEEFTSDLQETFGLRRVRSGLFDLANVSDKFRSPLNHIPSIFVRDIIIKNGSYPCFL